MTGVYQKVNGTWTPAAHVWVKNGQGVYVSAKSAWVKRSGAWVKAYEYDVVPPDPPEISLEIIEHWSSTKNTASLTSRWIKVGVRLPAVNNDPTARLARVLTTYAGKPPTTPLGGYYTEKPDVDWPKEAWSNWQFNSYGDHNDTSNFTYKQWPLNPKDGVIIKGDTDYYFGAWSLDIHGNWSVATQASIHVPKDSVQANNIIIKEARFQPNIAGSWRTSTGFASGYLEQQNSPRSWGQWFYGQQLSDSFSANPDIRSAQIWIQREDDDGVANANVYLFWNGYGGLGDLPSVGAGGYEKNSVTKLGTLAKGQGKWFDLPDSYISHLNTDIHGLGLDYRDPVKASAFPEDYSRVVDLGTNLRCGEIHITWSEAT